MPVISKYLHAEAAVRYTRHLRPDVAHAENAERLALHIFSLHLSDLKIARLQLIVVLHAALREHQNQTHRVLRDRLAV